MRIRSEKNIRYLFEEIGGVKQTNIILKKFLFD